MTKPTIALTELVEKGTDADLLKQMIQFVKSPDRTNSRNGYRDRLWQTRAGDVDLKIPSCARVAISQGSWSHGALPRRPWQR